jgi:hypothetical protein
MTLSRACTKKKITALEKGIDSRMGMETANHCVWASAQRENYFVAGGAARFQFILALLPPGDELDGNLRAICGNDAGYDSAAMVHLRWKDNFLEVAIERAGLNVRIFLTELGNMIWKVSTIVRVKTTGDIVGVQISTNQNRTGGRLGFGSLQLCREPMQCSMSGPISSAGPASVSIGPGNEITIWK